MLAEAFHVLPYSGGLLDQPGSAILRMERILEARNEKEEHDREVDKLKRTRDEVQ